MKIVFICGSLEPGKDGVGDYTRRLAAAIIKNGYKATLIALRDKYVAEFVSNFQDTEGTSVPILRLPAKFPTEIILKRCKEYISVFNPDWISLQYVPFSFQDKGLPFGLSKLVNQITKGYRLHIMFHELWVGMNKEATLKMFCWGYVQKKMVISFFKQVNPLLVHTQTKFYQQQLNKISIVAKLLPLFSNIKVVAQETRIKYKSNIHLIVFGSIHPGAPINDFAKEAAEYCLENNLEIALNFIGRCGNEQERWASVWRLHGMQATILGEQPEKEISYELSNASIGVANTPYELMDKSGAVAAMKEHGLPIICLSHNWTYNEICNEEINKKSFQYTKGNLPLLINKKTLPHKTNLAVIATFFVNELLLCKKDYFS